VIYGQLVLSCELLADVRVSKHKNFRLIIHVICNLGVSYDTYFSFRPHINNIVSKVSLRAKLILKCFTTRNPNILCKAFCVFIRPTLEFSSEIWNPYFKVDVNKTEKCPEAFYQGYMPNLPYSDRLSQLGFAIIGVSADHG